MNFSWNIRQARAGKWTLLAHSTSTLAFRLARGSRMETFTYRNGRHFSVYHWAGSIKFINVNMYVCGRAVHVQEHVSRVYMSAVMAFVCVILYCIQSQCEVVLLRWQQTPNTTMKHTIVCKLQKSVRVYLFVWALSMWCVLLISFIDKWQTTLPSHTERVTLRSLYIS